MLKITKPPKWHQWRRFGSFIANFEHISHFCSSVSIVNFERVIAGWDAPIFFLHYQVRCKLRYADVERVFMLYQES